MAIDRATLAGLLRPKEKYGTCEVRSANSAPICATHNNNNNSTLNAPIKSQRRRAIDNEV